MNIRPLHLIGIALLMIACGSKPTTSEAEKFITTTDAYIIKIDGNSKLIEEFTEGALTDQDGFNDIGRFKSSVLFDKVTKELFRIENTEITDKTITERYYFHNHRLVYIEVSTSGKPNKKIYVRDSKKVVSKLNVSDVETKVLINKAKRFQLAFQRRE